MNTFALWLKTPFPKEHFPLYLIGSWLLVSAVWIVIPSFLEPINWQYLTLPLTPRNIVIAIGQSFGEEVAFRVFPLLAILTLYPGRIVSTFAAGSVSAYFFGTWHGWSLIADTCLGLGGVILAIVYLKSGGAHGKPFHGLMVCGGIHAAFNLSVTLFAHVIVGFT